MTDPTNFSPIIEINDIHLYEPAAITGFSIDAPILNARLRSGSVEFRGWVLGRKSPVVAVHLETRGAFFLRVPLGDWRPEIAADYPSTPNAERSGFRVLLDLSALGALFTVAVRAEFADGSIEPLATIRAGLAKPRPEPVEPAHGGDPDAEISPKPAFRPDVSIVIPVHNQCAMTRQVLTTLLSPGNIELPYEIIVVNDASTDETPDALNEFADRIRIVSLQPNLGFGGACNAGAGMARGRWVCFLNNDTIPRPGWLNSMLDYADRNPAVGIVGNKLLFPTGEIQHAGVAFGLDGYPHHVYAGFPEHHPACDHPRALQAVTGACLMIRQELFSELGGFDRVYQNGWEDVDLCLRARAAGYEVHYCPESVVVHVESVSRNPDSIRERRNRQHWAERWLGKVETDCFRIWAEDGLFGMDNIGPYYPVRLWHAPELIVAMTDREKARSQSWIRPRPGVMARLRVNGPPVRAGHRRRVRAHERDLDKRAPSLAR